MSSKKPALTVQLILSSRHTQWKKSSHLGKSKVRRTKRVRFDEVHELEGYDSSLVPAVLSVDTSSGKDIFVCGQDMAVEYDIVNKKSKAISHGLGGRRY